MGGSSPSKAVSSNQHSMNRMNEADQVIEDCTILSLRKMLVVSDLPGKLFDYPVHIQI